MTIELAAGEEKQLNVALTPSGVVPQIVIEQLFIGTSKHTWETGADCGIYVQLRNLGTTEVSGRLHVYDWQEWWGDPPGDEREQRDAPFTMPPNGIFRISEGAHLLAFDTSYIRIEVEVNGVLVAESPRVYFIPGKEYGGSIDPSSGDPAEGECTYTAPGLAVLWMASDSDHKGWDGSYRTPPLGERIHWNRFSFDTDPYDHEWWEAVFLVIFDEGFISRAEYAVNITGGDGASVCHYTTRFNFIAA